ncbi:MAG: sensor histidine kinase [bacterium]|nr:sensor histidine kinase [bacterium]
MTRLPIRVRQIIRNLFTNADHCGGDRVRIEAAVDDGVAILIVRDSGSPLPPERRADLPTVRVIRPGSWPAGNERSWPRRIANSGGADGWNYQI